MYANDPWSNIELQDPSRSLNNKEKRSTKHHILETGYCFFLSSPIYVSRCFFLASLWRKAGCKRWRSRPLIFRFFVTHFWRADDFFCTKCACLFSSPLPVLSRIHWDRDRGGGRAGSLPHPFYLLHHKNQKIKITFRPVLKKDLDNLTFFNFFFLKYQCMTE